MLQHSFPFPQHQQTCISQFATFDDSCLLAKTEIRQVLERKTRIVVSHMIPIGFQRHHIQVVETRSLHFLLRLAAKHLVAVHGGNLRIGSSAVARTRPNESVIYSGEENRLLRRGIEMKSQNGFSVNVVFLGRWEQWKIHLPTATQGIHQVAFNLFGIVNALYIKPFSNLLHTQHKPSARSVTKSTHGFPNALRQRIRSLLHLEIIPFDVLQPRY